MYLSYPPLLPPSRTPLSYPPLVGPDDETVGLQAKSFITPAMYDSARTQLGVEVRNILAFGQVRANENRLCQVFRSQMNA